VSSGSGYDAVVVGSGINGLVAAALLATRGWSVCVLERNDRLGGAIRTAELTRPGFVHEALAAWHSPFVASPAYERLGAELTTRGVEYLHADFPAANVHPDGSAVVLSRSQDENASELERHGAGDGEAWRRTVDAFRAESPLVRDLLTREPTLRNLARTALRHRRLGLSAAGELLASCRDWASESFRSDAARGLFATWGLHAGLGPDAAASAVMARAVTVPKQLGGTPAPKGGGRVLVDALAEIVRDAGGDSMTEAEVDRVIVADGRAVGVRTADGAAVLAERAVIAGVTPQQLYLRLLGGEALPQRVLQEARRFRFGRAGMTIHMALSEPPRWQDDERLGRAAVLHLTSGLDAVARAAAEADSGLLPAEPTIAVGQPVAVDPSRAPAGSSILWIQLHELPPRPRGDAAGVIDVRDGTWTETLRESYADRIQARLAHQVPNLESALLQRAVLSPADLEAANLNLIGGDMYAGSLALDQSAIWRPRLGMRGHRTPIRGLYLVGASTQPGPGLGAGSGTIVADELLGRRRP
jgi:phytoene dehydrogenase-like protein